MKLKYHLIALISLAVLLPEAASANPHIGISPRLRFFLIAVPILLFAEGIIISLLARPSQVRAIRFTCAWFMVTALTWVLFSGFLDFLRPLVSNVTSVTVLEIGVTIIEAGAIWVMLRMTFFQNGQAILRRRHARYIIVP